MPAPFVYQPVTGQREYANNIASLMLEQGNAQAQGVRQAGQIWGQGIQRVGQDIGNTIQYETDPRTQLVRAEVTQNQLAMKYQTMATKVAQSLTGPNGEQPSPDVAEGLMTKAGIPVTYQKPILDSLVAVNNRHKENYADIAHIVYRTLQSLPQGSDPNEAVMTALGGVKAYNGIADSDIANVSQMLASGANPKGVALGLMAQSPSGRYKDIVQDETKPIVLPGAPRGGGPSTLYSPTQGVMATGAPAAPQAGEPVLMTEKELPRYQAQLDAIVPPSDGLHAGLRTATWARITNARNTTEANKAIEDAQSIVKSDSEPMTVKTMQGGAPVEKVMTRAQALSMGQFPSQPPASIQVQNLVGANEKPVDATRPDPLDPASNVPDKISGLTPNSLYQSAVEFALTKSMPPTGFGQAARAQAVRSQIPNKAAALAAAAGTTYPALQAEYRANATALNRLVPQAQATANFANTARDNIDLALAESPNVARTGAKLVNRYAQWAQGELTPATGLSKLETYIYTAAREYAKVTSGGALSAQGLTDSAQKEAQKLMNAAQAPETLAAVADAMKNDMANVIGEQNKGIGRVSQTIANFLNVANGGNPSGTTSSTTAQPIKVGGFTVVIHQ